MNDPRASLDATTVFTRRVCLLGALTLGCGAPSHGAGESGRVSLRIHTHEGARYHTESVFTDRCPTETTTFEQIADLTVIHVDGSRITLRTRSETHTTSTDTRYPPPPGMIVERDVVIDDLGRHIEPPPEPGMPIETGGILPDHEVRFGDRWRVHAEIPATQLGSIEVPGSASDTEYTYVDVERGTGVEMAVVHSRSLGGHSVGDVRISIPDAMIRTERSRSESERGCVATFERSTTGE